MRDLLYRKTNKIEYQNAIRSAYRIIEDALKYNSCGKIAVAVSGGKDSTALTHLVSNFVKPVLLWNDSGLELPESKDTVYELSVKLNCDLIVAKGDAEVEWVKNLQGIKNNVDQKSLFGPSQKAIKENGISLEFVGLREEESKTRRIMMRKHGSIFFNKRWGCITAFPMRFWKTDDVFAYIDEFNLPLHPAYKRTEWKERNKIRVSWVFDDMWEAEGQAEYCRKYYPKTYRKLKDIGIIK